MELKTISVLVWVGLGFFDIGELESRLVDATGLFVGSPVWNKCISMYEKDSSLSRQIRTYQNNYMRGHVYVPSRAEQVNLLCQGFLRASVCPQPCSVTHTTPTGILIQGSGLISEFAAAFLWARAVQDRSCVPPSRWAPRHLRGHPKPPGAAVPLCQHWARTL